MKIECPSCAAKYSIGDDKVQDRLAKIRCRKCGTTIVIDGKHNPPNIYAADASSAAGDLTATPSAAPAPSAAAPSSSEFTIDFGDGDQRNLTLAQVVNAYNKGEVTAEHYVWAEGFDDWRALGEVEQIVEALHTSARNPAFATPAAAAPRAAAIVGRGGADLFGGIDQAGSEEDVTTSAATADIMPSAPAATGARNESSVLFSLSALTSAAAKPSGGGFDGLATSSSSSSSKEDSGLIDLKALTAAAAASERREAPAPMGMGMGLGLTPAPLGGVSAPLGLAPPLGGHATSAAMAFDPGPMPQQKNRTGLYIAAGIVIAAVAVALIVVTSKEEPAPIPSATPIAAPTPPPAPAPTPTPTAESTAQPPATGTPAEEDAGTAEKKAPVASRSTWRPKKTTTTSSTTQTSSKSGSSSAAEKPKKKPATSSCGCAPGDLQCAMRCAAGG